MPRTLPAALTTVMDAGVYEPYLRVAVAEDTSSEQTTEPLYFKLEALKAEVKIQRVTDGGDNALYDYFRIIRGAVISGTPSTITSIFFRTKKTAFDGKFVTLYGEALSDEYTTVAAGSTYKQLIETADGAAPLSISFEGTAAWKDYQFYPTGKAIVMNKRIKQFTLLRQKYLVFATEDGWSGTANQFFYFCATDTRAQDYTFIDQLFSKAFAQAIRKLIWRDENNTIHTDGLSSSSLHNLGFLPSTASGPPNVADLYIGSKSAKLPVHLKYRTGDVAANTGAANLNTFSGRIQVTEIFDPASTPSWHMIIEKLSWFGNTEGGALPSTIEAAAPYTPLATGNFDAVLSSNDNNVQAAMETIDDHVHNSQATTFALTGDISPTELSASQNNYNPTGLSTASVIRLTANNDYNITGLQGGADGRIIIILNVDTADTITLKDESSSSDAANRFQLVSDIALEPGDGIALIYDSTSSRWRQLSPFRSDAYLTSIINTIVPKTGWILDTNTWSYSSADAPTFVISVNADMTESLTVGDRIGLVQTTPKYFIVTAVGSFSAGATLITVYGGTDYTLANAAITSPSYSHGKSPFGFPTDPAKWTVSTITTDTPTKATPTASTWYGGTGLSPTGPSIDLPIGAWRVFYRAVAEWSENLAAIANAGCRVTLSTANNSESDAELTTGFTVTVPISATALQRGTYSAEKHIAVASKTTYYLNIFTGNSGVDNIYFNPGAVFKNVIKAVCAYL